MKSVPFSVFACALILGVRGQDSGLQGDLQGIYAVFPSDGESYANASRPFNLRYDYMPEAIAYPDSIEQVSQAVKAANAHNLTVVARSGGHSYIANALAGALILDMSRTKSISIHNESGTATITTGNRLGDIALALDAEGRGMPHGSCPYVGIGGHAGYGGFGFQSRMWGLTLDTIESVKVVLANGTVASASETENSDLFWGLRGAAPSFGIIYSMDAKTFASPPSTTSAIITWICEVPTCTSIVSSFQSFAASVSGTLGGEINIGKYSVQNQLSMSFVGVWYGPLDEFNSTMAPFLDAVPKPDNMNVTAGTYRTALEFTSGNLDTTSQPDYTDTFYAKSLLTFQDEELLSNETINAYLSYLSNEAFVANVSWFTQIELYGGSKSAINAVPQDSTAFAYRNVLFNFQLYSSSAGNVPPYPEENFEIIDGMYNSIISNQPKDWKYGAYTNYLEDRLENWQQLYYSSHYPRLQALKSAVDPKNVFSFPIGVEPASNSSSTSASAKVGRRSWGAN